MYLVDSQLEALLPELDFDTPDPAHPFLPTEQIQPCSIDLRLDSVFWRHRRGRPIDLRHARVADLHPRRHWRKIVLSSGQSVRLKPGEMILARTFEQFTIPRGYSGKLEGRSSFARLGISIHCSADFINPGYRGHMPLQIVNNGKSAVILVPGPQAIAMG
jgi:deoxycytidine triphosphate deaminase